VKINNNRSNILRLYDINRDEFDDIFVKGQVDGVARKEIRMLINNRDGTFSGPKSTPSSFSNLRSFELGNLNGDEYVDIIANAKNQQTVSEDDNYYFKLFEGVSRENFSHALPVEIGFEHLQFDQTFFKVADFNNDGFDDITYTARTEAGYLLLYVVINQLPTGGCGVLHKPIVNGQASSKINGENLTVSIKTMGDVQDLFYYSFEAKFDSEALEFQGVEAGDLMNADSSMVSVGLNDSNTAGISVGRTTESGADGTGDILHLNFNIKDYSSTFSCIEFSNIKAKDRLMNSLGAGPINKYCIRPDDAKIATIWPGDANVDGEVNELDVLPLGEYWGQTGPKRSGNFKTWKPDSTVLWKEEAATYVDTDGNGRVDQDDLMPISLHFGQSASEDQKKINTINKLTTNLNDDEIIFSKTIPALRAGETVDFTFANLSKMEIRGLAFRILLDEEIQAKATLEVKYANWIYDWNNLDKISFAKHQDNIHSFAVTTTSADISEVTVKDFQPLVIVTITANERIKNGNKLYLPHFFVQDQQGNHSQPDKVGIFTSDEMKNIFVPEKTKLMDSYPNPFNPTTTISYKLSEDGYVNISVYDILGKLVATLVDENKTAGNYQVIFDGQELSSGIYFYHMKVNQRNFMTKKMTLVK